MYFQGGSHTIECLTTAVNWAVHDHATLPNKLYVQLDNAGTNKNGLFLAWLARYVYYEVFDEARRFTLSSHCLSECMRIELSPHPFEIHLAYHLHSMNVGQ